MKDGWNEFAAYADAASAEVAAGLLRSEGVSVEIISDEPIPGLTRGFRLLVPSQMMHRARQIVSDAAFTDEELHLFAAGEIGSEDESAK